MEKDCFSCMEYGKCQQKIFLFSPFYQIFILINSTLVAEHFGIAKGKGRGGGGADMLMPPLVGYIYIL